MGTCNHCLGPRQIARFEQAASLLPGVDPVEVYRFYIRHTQSGRKSVLLADASRSYLQMLVETGRAVAYVSHARKALEDFAEELGSRDVSDYDAESIRGHLYGLNYSPVTIRHQRGHLLCAFVWWAEQGWIDANPVEKVKRPNVESGEPGILPVANMERRVDHNAARHVRALDRGSEGLKNGELLRRVEAFLFHDKRTKNDILASPELEDAVLRIIELNS